MFILDRKVKKSLQLKLCNLAYLKETNVCKRLAYKHLVNQSIFILKEGGFNCVFLCRLFCYDVSISDYRVLW